MIQLTLTGYKNMIYRFMIFISSGAEHSHQVYHNFIWLLHSQGQEKDQGDVMGN